METKRLAHCREEKELRLQKILEPIAIYKLQKALHFAVANLNGESLWTTQIHPKSARAALTVTAPTTSLKLTVQKTTIDMSMNINACIATKNGQTM